MRLDRVHFLLLLHMAMHLFSCRGPFLVLSAVGHAGGPRVH